MAKDKNAPRYDKQGARRVMRKRDYLADLGGQLALGLMANLVGQLNYFYTDKVGLAVGSVGIVLAISKVIDAFTDVIAGNFIDHSKGGDHKYFRWILPQIIPAALIMVLMFTVPIQAGQIPGVIYALITNLVLSAGLYTFIATPFAAVMTVRSRSLSERGSIGLFRAVANYGAGMLISILTIPVTNMLGGTQSAWIKYGVVLGVLVFVLFAICCHNGRKAKFACDYEEEETEGAAEEEEEPVEEDQKELSLACTSIEKDLKIKIEDQKSKLVTGEQFSVSVKSDKKNAKASSGGGCRYTAIRNRIGCPSPVTVFRELLFEIFPFRTNPSKGCLSRPGLRQDGVKFQSWRNSAYSGTAHHTDG